MNSGNTPGRRAALYKCDAVRNAFGETHLVCQHSMDYAHVSEVPPSGAGYTGCVDAELGFHSRLSPANNPPRVSGGARRFANRFRLPARILFSIIENRP